VASSRALLTSDRLDARVGTSCATSLPYIGWRLNAC
jgi:hypothetical protein